MMLPIIQLAQNGPEPARSDDQVPARVRLAFAVLQHYGNQQQSYPALSDVAIEWSTPRKLAPSEDLARNAAADLLADYLSGRFKMDVREQLHHQQLAAGDGHRDGRLINCPNCVGQYPSRACKLCRGCGTVLISPVSDHDRDPRPNNGEGK
jgi:hypothetical protein